MKDMKNKIEKSYKVVKIEGNSEQKTLFFEVKNKKILPGQFFMLNYNICQKPFSVSHYDGSLLGFTILKRGAGTEKMLTAIEGDYFGLTGPLGNSFNTADSGRYLLIGGGVGAAPVFFMANYLNSIGKECDILLGARTQALLEFALELEKLEHCNSYFYTDDGSFGKKGFVTQDLEQLLSDNSYCSAAMCGPEKMMSIAGKLVDGNIERVELSMERYMKCGIGICGSCVLDDIGMRVCEDGPVFDYKTLLKSREFGNYHRNSGGVIEQI